MREKTTIGGAGRVLPTPASRSAQLPTFKALPPRVVIEGIHPQVDHGRFPIKRVVGESVEVSADIFADGHDRISAVLLHREEGSAWQAQRMLAKGNDRWTAMFSPKRIGRAYYTIEAWVDHFATWRDGFQKKVAAGQDVAIE